MKPAAIRQVKQAGFVFLTWYLSWLLRGDWLRIAELIVTGHPDNFAGKDGNPSHIDNSTNNRAQAWKRPVPGIGSALVLHIPIYLSTREPSFPLILLGLYRSIPCSWIGYIFATEWRIG
ncbi:MAG: hypothetical protein BGO99_06305 [Nitrosospira sp. 56-18]|nr:MAG: hypothetical protein BGO99_06305 [Nitrosospira sp. 56-18]